MIKLGPILKFLGCQDDTWGVSALVVTAVGDTTPILEVSGQPKPLAVKLRELPHSNSCVWRFDFAIAQTAVAQRVQYSLDGAVHFFEVPPKSGRPAMAYVSCNGFSDPKLMKQVDEQNALWARMGRLHEAQDKIRGRQFGPWSLLLMGGDQVYSDMIWHAIPELSAWCDLPWKQREVQPFTDGMRARVEDFFENLYLTRWAQPEVAAIMASIPTVMMWDDHDIMDGWGSYPWEQHSCPVYQGLFAIARDYFKLFQLQATNALPPATLPAQTAFNKAFRMGSMGLLALDMRSERQPHKPAGPQDADHTPDQVMSEQSWNAVYKWLDAQNAMSHLLVMSSIPVVHPSFGLLEKMLGFLPGQQELEDDLRDHWTSSPHLQERLRLVHRLLRLSAEKNCRVTLLSGDVHVAAVGAVESDRNDVHPNARVVNQLTSSGIVHPAPPAMARFFLEQACTNVETVDRGITARMYEFPATSRRLIGARNFLTLEPDAQDRLWANWWVEGEADPTTKVIHPVQTNSAHVEPSSDLSLLPGTPAP
jgi:hypothetical protein